MQALPQPQTATHAPKQCTRTHTHTHAHTLVHALKYMPAYLPTHARTCLRRRRHSHRAALPQRQRQQQPLQVELAAGRRQHRQLGRHGRHRRRGQPGVHRGRRQPQQQQQLGCGQGCVCAGSRGGSLSTQGPEVMWACLICRSGPPTRVHPAQPMHFLLSLIPKGLRGCRSCLGLQRPRLCCRSCPGAVMRALCCCFFAQGCEALGA